jgi:hypothetical protein
LKVDGSSKFSLALTKPKVSQLGLSLEKSATIFLYVLKARQDVFQSQSYNQNSLVHLE